MSVGVLMSVGRTLGALAVTLAAIAALTAIVAKVVRDTRRRRRLRHARGDLVSARGWRWADAERDLQEVARHRFLSGEPIGRAVTGEHRGRRIDLLDWEVRTSKGWVFEYHLIAVRLPVALPRLELHRDSAARRALGGDVRLESDGFNQTFAVTATDERFACAFLHPRMMEYALRHPDFAWGIAGDLLLTWGHGLWRPGPATEALDILSDIADRIPAFVLDDYGRAAS